MQQVFKMEQDKYTKEELSWSYIEFIDNKNVIDLIEKVYHFQVMEDNCGASRSSNFFNFYIVIHISNIFN
ncbi:hypothetical protein KSP40_PGU001199 [Platanthera guangdongensis]|uniref:Myosin motor domain-containing protein n=1 Tax=Platanthera guangdongensis TaxID=2320717 RepID=A0ABR2N4F1_9ASPA